MPSGVITICLLALCAILHAANSSSPIEFMANLHGYRAACHKLGFESKQDPVIENITAFHANLKSHLNNVAVETVISFEDVLLNQGGGYNPQTGIFTAPDDGLYSFTWAFLTKKGGTIYLSAVVDNVTKVRSCVKNLQEDYISTSGHLLYKLKRGSQVWIQTYYLIATYIHANTYTYFSGHRIN